MGCSTLWLRPSVDRTSARIASTTSSLWLMPLRPFCPTQALLTRDRRAPAPTAPERAKRRYSSKRNNRPDDLLDHHAIVVLLAVGQFIIGNEGRMGLDLVVASRAALSTTLHALLCTVGRELLDQTSMMPERARELVAATISFDSLPDHAHSWSSLGHKGLLWPGQAPRVISAYLWSRTATSYCVGCSKRSSPTPR